MPALIVKVTGNSDKLRHWLYWRERELKGLSERIEFEAAGAKFTG